MTIYMQIKGIPGNVSNKTYQGWIELESFESGLGRAVNNGVGGAHNREGSLPEFSQITVSKRSDKSSPLLFEHACRGRVIPEVMIEICNSMASNKAYSTYKLSKVIISHYSDSALGSDIDSFEHLKLSFTRVERTYTPHDVSNQASSPISSGFDLQTAENI